MIYDVESFIDDAIAVIKSNIASEIAAINSEKNDALTLLVPVNEAWFFQNTNDDYFNFEPFVLYALESVAIETSFDENNIKKIRLTIEIGFSDSGMNPNDSVRKLLRYTRALEQAFTKNYRKIDSASNVSLESLSPMGVDAMGKTIYVAGIAVNASLTT